jgi:Na+/serine symporter
MLEFGPFSYYSPNNHVQLEASKCVIEAPAEALEKVAIFIMSLSPFGIFFLV